MSRGKGKVCPTPIHRYLWHHENVAITVQQLDKALNNQMMFDGSSIEALLESRIGYVSLSRP